MLRTICIQTSSELLIHHTLPHSQGNSPAFSLLTKGAGAVGEIPSSSAAVPHLARSARGPCLAVTLASPSGGASPYLPARRNQAAAYTRGWQGLRAHPSSVPQPFLGPLTLLHPTAQPHTTTLIQLPHRACLESKGASSKYGVYWALR